MTRKVVKLHSRPSSHLRRTRTRGAAADAFRLLLPFARPHWRTIAVAAMVVVAGTVTRVLEPWPLKVLFDRVLVADAPSATGRLLLLVPLSIAGIAVLQSALGFLRQYLLTTIGQRVATAVRTALYEQLQRQNLTYHDQQQTGELLTRLTSDVDKVQGVVTDDAVDNASNVLTIVAMLVVMYVLDWRLSTAMLLLLPLLFLTNVHFRRRIKAGEQVVRSKEGRIASLAEQTISSIRVVQAFGRERYESRRFDDENALALDAGLRVARVEAAFGAVMNVLTAAALGGLVWFGARRVLSGSLTPGELLVFISYLRSFYGPVQSLSRFNAALYKASVRAEKIAEVLHATPEVTDRPGAVTARALRGALEFDRVRFGYAPDRPVLHDVSFAVEPGQTVALVGATGAGKSTLAGLVPRLYDVSSGAVLLDGRDVREYTVESLRSQIALVLQSSLLFRATVRENIAYGDPAASVEQVLAAARVANAHDFICALPQGYDTLVGERGDTLSGGQRQRIAIARAVVRDAPVLVLDEPTTGLDAGSEALVLEALARLMQGRTTLTIAHKLASVTRADLIVVLEAGRVLEHGRHDELLAAGGRYAELCALQGVGAGAS